MKKVEIIKKDIQHVENVLSILRREPQTTFRNERINLYCEKLGELKNELQKEGGKK